ncbi:glycoside hydrolase family 6 protein [Hypomontagnella monticulosa]|nr:glycoside hydrolase family 6 protein [Hypomontagnella monticulosa]
MELTIILSVLATVAAISTGDTSSNIQAPGSSCSTPAVLDAGTNVWKDHTLYPDPNYREKVMKAAEAIKDVELREKASKIADIGTFMWMKTSKDVQNLAKVASAVPCDHIVGLVLDNLPYKGPGQNGEFKNETLSQYQTSYIDPIANAVKASTNTSFAIIVEPRAFPKYFNETGASDSLARSYRENVPYALKALNLPNVITYLDVGNSNSLDWDRLRNTTAKEAIAIYKAAGSPSQFRGFSTNVASFNSWDLMPGEFVSADDSRYIRPQNEQHFVRIFSDALQKNGLPPTATHAIMDTNRSGVFGLRLSWDDWCNVDGAGLGTRPTQETGDERLDAFVWVKHPGESDGGSDPTELPRDPFCAKEDAFKPSPAAGLWHQAYFEMVVRNAHPSL